MSATCYAALLRGDTMETCCRMRLSYGDRLEAVEKKKKHLAHWTPGTTQNVTGGSSTKLQTPAISAAGLFDWIVNRFMSF